MTNCNWATHTAGCFDEYLEKCGYSQKTKNSYKAVFMSFINFAEKYKESFITANERIIAEWLESISVSQQTEIRYIRLLSQIYGDLLECRIIEKNVASSLYEKRVKMKRGKIGKRLLVSLDEREFDLLMSKIASAAVRDRVKVIVLILVGCGLRVTELCTLKARNVHLDTDQPYLTVIGKGDKEREVPIPEEICHRLEHHEAALPNLNGFFVGIEKEGILKPYTASGIYRMIQNIMRDAGIIKRRMSPHVLRHTYATRQLQAGIPITVVKMWMGHESTATTMKYEHSVIARSAIRPKL